MAKDQTSKFKLGIFGTLIGIVSIFFSLTLPYLTNNQINIEQAVIGVLLGAVILLVSIIFFIIGLILKVLNK